MVPPATPSWSLDPQLARDTVLVGDLPLSRLLAMDDMAYPWLLLVPRWPGATELLDLDEADQSQLLRETTQVGRALKDLTGCDKLNVAAIGNVVRQLHIHIVARRVGDPAWPRPIWGLASPVRHETESLVRFINALRSRLAL
ncbi:MAG TPA: HIT family protein [Xanthobacteraceae bacterium]|nr:HIT family protein [Xanthobacteraceae bacterium]